MGGQGLELVGRARERLPGEPGQSRSHPFPEAHGRVEPGAHRGASDGQLVESGQGRPDHRQTVVEHGDPARDLLTQGERGGVLEMGATDLDDIGEGQRLLVEDIAELQDGGNEAAEELAHRGQVHGGGKGVVGGLRAVHVIIGMHRLLRAHLAAQELDGAVADHFIGVHVALGAAARLPDHQRKVVVELACYHLVGGLDDGRRHVLGQEPELVIDLCAGPLELAERPDHLSREALARDLEMLERALRLRAPVAVGGHLDGAHAVGLASCRHVR